MNIRVDLNTPIKDGMEVPFRSPVDCSQVTGLTVCYRAEDGNTASKEFAFADAHGNNVGDIDHLFAENVVVKVILDVTTGMAFVQNADTNAYLEGRFAALEYYSTNREEVEVSHENLNADYIFGLYDALVAEHPGKVKKNAVHNNDGSFTNYEYVISTGDYSDDGVYELRDGDDGIKKPKYLVMSGIDGTERLNVFSTYRFVRDILRGHNVPQFFKEDAVVHVLPVGSPWGFTKWDRYNENRVHVHLNFDCEWVHREGTGANNTEWTSGDYAASEKETQAITKWLNDNADADLYITYHNSSGINEIAIILGDSSNYETDMAKKIAMRGVSKVIPFWKNAIGYPTRFEGVPCPVFNEVTGKYEYGYADLDTIFSYSANTRVGGTDILYAQEKLGIPSLAIETPVYYGNYADYEAAGKAVYNAEAIAAGAEVLGNILIEYYEQSVISEVNRKMDSKLNKILQGISFRIEKGSFTPSANTNVFTTTDIPAGAKMIEIVLQGEQPIPYASPYVTVHYLLAIEALQNGAVSYAGKGALVDYYVNASSGYKREIDTFDNTNGFTVTMSNTGSIIATFGAGKTYNWTAYYWDE